MTSDKRVSSRLHAGIRTISRVGIRMRTRVRVGVAITIALTASGLTNVQGCVDYEHGALVELSAVVHRQDGAAGAIVSATAPFTNDLGYEIQLTRAELALTDFSLVRCDGISAPEALRALLSPAVARAHTHGEGSSAAVTAWLVDALDAVPEEAHVATLEPAIGRYCGLHVRFGEGGATASSPSRPAIWLEGTYRAPGVSSAVPFDIVVETEEAAETTLGEDVLTLDADTDASLTIGFALDHWLDGVDFLRMDDDARAARLRKAVVASAHRHDVPAHAGH